MGAGRRRRARSSASTASPATCSCATPLLPDPRPGDVLVTPGDRRLRVRARQQLQRPAPPAGGVLLRRPLARGGAPRDLRGAAWPRRLSPSASACWATAPSAPRSSAAGRARRRGRRHHRPAPGAQRRADALARRLRGDPRGLGPDRGADRRHRAGARVRAAGDARRQARRLGQQAAALPARRGAVGVRARARRAAALRGRGRRRRAGDPRAAGVAGRRARRAHPRDRQRHDELHPVRDGARRDLLRAGAAAGPGARLRGGRPDRRRDGPRRRRQDGDPRPAGVLDPGPPRPGHLRGDRAHHGRRHGLRATSSGSG